MQRIIDVIAGTGGTFSLEGLEGKVFKMRSCVFDDVVGAFATAPVYRHLPPNMRVHGLPPRRWP